MTDEMNSIGMGPVMKQKIETGTAPSCEETEKRHFSRVITNYANRLVLGETSHPNVKIRDLSISGCFISGLSTAEVCDTCCVELYKKNLEGEPVLRLTARVVRVDTDGLALMFVDMDDRTLMFLQTLVLYSTDDPVKIAGEFVNEINIFVDGGCQ